MPDAERLGARSRCFIAPVGAAPWDAAAWHELPVSDSGVAPAFTANVTSVQQVWPGAVTIPSGGWPVVSDENSMLRLQDRINKAFYDHDYSMPSRWMLGIDPQIFPKINERSKPMGLTREHKYADKDGDAIRADEPDADESPYAVAYLAISQVDGNDGFYVTAENSIPLALNVLGYDRPDSKLHAAGSTTYNGHTADTSIPSARYSRDANVAEAIDLLIGADIFDQREVERKEFEAKAAAKRDAEYAKHKQDGYDNAKRAYADAIRDQIASGIDAKSAAKVQAALSAYETARRKLEGLPN